MSTPTKSTAGTVQADLVDLGGPWLRKIDPILVSRLHDALRGGATLPPIRVEAGGTLRLIDGMHRREAHILLRKDPQVILTCTLETYAAERDLIAAGLASNARHGRCWGTPDVIRLIHLAEQAGIPPEETCTLLSISADRYKTLKPRHWVREDGTVEPLKWSLNHLQDTQPTPALLDLNRHATVSAGRLATELLRHLTAGGISRSNQETQAALGRLHRALDDYLASPAAPEVAS